MLGHVLGWALNLPALLCLSLLSAVLISCTTTPYTPSTVAAPPQVPGATFVGNHACSVPSATIKFTRDFTIVRMADFIGVTRFNGRRLPVASLATARAANTSRLV